MKYLDYREHREQGTFNFPIAFYHENSHSPRYHMPYHWHHHYEILRIMSGAFHLTLDSNTRSYYAGDVIFITDGMLHGGNPDDNTCVYDCIVFDLQILMKDNHICSKSICDIMSHKITINTLLSEDSSAILPIVDSLTSALSGRHTGYEFMTQGYLYQLLGIILEEHLYKENTRDLIEAGHLNSIKNVLTYISENYDNNISLDMLAKIAGMNPKYFCRYFRSMTERTPIDYLNYYRIECACEMLTTKNISVKEAAISCGFNDESYFIKTFHKYKGITPKQFSKMEF
ncbi:AraC family transcriptional regulator [Lachnospiraceae bacterium 54-11]